MTTSYGSWIVGCRCGWKRASGACRTGSLYGLIPSTFVVDYVITIVPKHVVEWSKVYYTVPAVPVRTQCGMPASSLEAHTTGRC
jgi:hypothetical protein